MTFNCNYTKKVDQHYDYMETTPPAWKTTTDRINYTFKIIVGEKKGKEVGKASVFYRDGPRVGIVRYNARYLVVIDFGSPSEDRTNIFSIFMKKEGDSSGLASTFVKTTHSMFFPTIWTHTGKCYSG